MSDSQANVEPAKATTQKYIPPWKRATQEHQSVNLSERSAQKQSTVEQQTNDATPLKSTEPPPLAGYDPDTVVLRQNVIYKVVPKSTYNFAKSIVQCLTRFPGESGVIYCRERWHTHFFAAQLRSEGISAEPFHAGVVGKPRSVIDQRWAQGDIRILCTTLANRAVANIPNVRFVIHRATPDAINKFCRALSIVGRDGKPSACIVLHKQTQRGRLVDLMEESRSYRNERLRGIEAMLAYCNNTEKCRRNMLADLIVPGNSVEVCTDEKTACDICRPDVADSCSESENEGDTWHDFKQNNCTNNNIK